MADVFPGGPEWWTTLCVLAALVALIAAARTSARWTHALRARYLALVLIVACVGGVAGRFPFGATGGPPFSRAERTTLWLVPVMAVGLAAVLQRLRRVVAGRSRLRIGFDAVVYATAVAVVLTGYRAAPAYPFPGSESATRFVEAQLRQHDAVLISFWSIYPFAVESASDALLRASPEETIGFFPHFSDPRLRVLKTEGAVQIRTAVQGAERVVVPFTSVFHPARFAAQTNLESTMRAVGFKFHRTVTFGAVLVMIWQRQRPAVASPSS